MAELTLRLEVDPATQQKRLLIGLESDPDALPMEHEDDHQALVERLLAAGLIGEGVGQLVIERGAARKIIDLPKNESATERQVEEQSG